VQPYKLTDLFKARKHLVPPKLRVPDLESVAAEELNFRERRVDGEGDGVERIYGSTGPHFRLVLEAVHAHVEPRLLHDVVEAVGFHRQELVNVHGQAPAVPDEERARLPRFFTRSSR
jgi:hypothetical protein